MDLGDTVENALASVGVTKERVAVWLGKPCGCSERQERLNSLHRWARRVILGRRERAREYLNSGDYQNACTSMLSDLGKHPETRFLQQTAGMMILLATRSHKECSDFIEGFAE